MIELATILTVLNIADKGKGLYDWFTGVSHGERLRKTVEELEKTKAEVKRLSDNLLWAPTYQQAINLENIRAQQIHDPKEVAAAFEPYARASQEQTIVTSIPKSPARLRAAFERDPFELLIDIRPAHRAKRPLDPDFVPIMFNDGHQRYIGWQKIGALPSLFECDFTTAAPTAQPKPIALEPATRSNVSISRSSRNTKTVSRSNDISPGQSRELSRNVITELLLATSPTSQVRSYDCAILYFTPEAIEVYVSRKSFWLGIESYPKYQMSALEFVTQSKLANADNTLPCRLLVSGFQRAGAGGYLSTAVFGKVDLEFLFDCPTEAHIIGGASRATEFRSHLARRYMPTIETVKHMRRWLDVRAGFPNWAATET